MKPDQARDDLRMVDDIVRAVDRTVRVSPAILITVGAICSIASALIQMEFLKRPVPLAGLAQPVGGLLILLVIAMTAWRQRGARRETLIDGYAGAAFLAAIAFSLVLNVTAQGHIIPPSGIGLIWAGSFSMALLIVGAMGSRILFAGGLAMLAAVGVAGRMGTWLPATVAVAWCVGFLIPGIALAIKKNG
jgi:hypothetical protein